MKIYFSTKAFKDIKGLEKPVKKRIHLKLKWFLSQEDPLIFAEKLTDFDIGEYRYRIGNYRVVFDVVGDTIQVNRIGHRREIYR